MMIEAREIKLKDGRTCVVRTPRKEDGQAVLDYMLQLNGETEFVLSYPDEFCITGEQEGNFLESLAQSPNGLMVACFDGEKCIGNAHIDFPGRDKLKHRASIAVGVLKDYWRNGLATAMFEILTEAAIHRPEVVCIGLEYIEGNDRACALYEKQGFKEIYRKPDAIRWRDGSIHAEIGMVKYLEK
ncbi:MAG: GNAT family N-acetyltransferase [Clostridia bacterium]|nr:GNAT family N-acetyltransferase [Clostridia bacterium]